MFQRRFRNWLALGRALTVITLILGALQTFSVATPAHANLNL